MSSINLLVQTVAGATTADAAAAHAAAAEACVARFEKLGSIEELGFGDALVEFVLFSRRKLQLSGAQRVRLVAALFELAVPRTAAQSSDTQLHASRRCAAVDQIVICLTYRAANRAHRDALGAVLDWRRLLAAIESHVAPHTAPRIGSAASTCDQLRGALIRLAVAARVYFPLSEIPAIVDALEPDLDSATMRHDSAESFRAIALLALFLPERAWPSATKPLAARCLDRWLALAAALSHSPEWHGHVLDLILRLITFAGLDDASWRSRSAEIVAQIRITLSPPVRSESGAAGAAPTPRDAPALYRKLSTSHHSSEQLEVAATLCVALMRGEGGGESEVVEMVCAELLRGSLRPFFHPSTKDARMGWKAMHFLSCLCTALAQRVGEQRGTAALLAATTATSPATLTPPTFEVNVNDDGLLSSSIARWEGVPPLTQASLDRIVGVALPFSLEALYALAPPSVSAACDALQSLAALAGEKVCTALFAQAARGLSKASAIYPHQQPALLSVLARVVRPCLRQRGSAQLLLRFLPELLPLTLNAIAADNVLKTRAAFLLIGAILAWMPIGASLAGSSASRNAAVTLIFGRDAPGIGAVMSSGAEEEEEEEDDEDDVGGIAMEALEEFSIMLVGRVVDILEAGDRSDPGDEGMSGGDGMTGRMNRMMTQLMLRVVRMAFLQMNGAIFKRALVVIQERVLAAPLPGALDDVVALIAALSSADPDSTLDLVLNSGRGLPTTPAAAASIAEDAWVWRLNILTGGVTAAGSAIVPFEESICGAIATAVEADELQVRVAGRALLKATLSALLARYQLPWQRQSTATESARPWRLWGAFERYDAEQFRWHEGSPPEHAIAAKLIEKHVVAHLDCGIATEASVEGESDAAAARTWRRRLLAMRSGVEAIAIAMPMSVSERDASAAGVKDFDFKVTVPPLPCTVGLRQRLQRWAIALSTAPPARHPRVAVALVDLMRVLVDSTATPSSTEGQVLRTTYQLNLMERTTMDVVDDAQRWAEWRGGLIAWPRVASRAYLIDRIALHRAVCACHQTEVDVRRIVASTNENASAGEAKASLDAVLSALIQLSEHEFASVRKVAQAAVLQISDAEARLVVPHVGPLLERLRADGGISDNALKASMFILGTLAGGAVWHASDPLAARREMLLTLCSTRAAISGLEPERQKAASARLFSLFTQSTKLWDSCTSAAGNDDVAGRDALAKTAQDLRQLANLSPAGAAAPKITWVDGMMRMESIRLITQQSGRSTEPPVEVWSAVTSAICTGTTPVMTQALYLLSILLQQRLDRTPLSSEAKGALLPKGFAAAFTSACARDHPNLRVGPDGRLDGVGSRQGWSKRVVELIDRAKSSASPRGSPLLRTRMGRTAENSFQTMHMRLCSLLLESTSCPQSLVSEIVAAAKAHLVDEGGSEQVARRCAAVEVLTGVLVCNANPQRCFDAALPTLLHELRSCSLPHLNEWADSVRIIAAANIAATATFDALENALTESVALAFNEILDSDGAVVDATPQQLVAAVRALRLTLPMMMELGASAATRETKWKRVVTAILPHLLTAAATAHAFKDVREEVARTLFFGVTSLDSANEFRVSIVDALLRGATAAVPTPARRRVRETAMYFFLLVAQNGDTQFSLPEITRLLEVPFNTLRRERNDSEDASGKEGEEMTLAAHCLAAAAQSVRVVGIAAPLVRAFVDAVKTQVGGGGDDRYWRARCELVHFVRVIRAHNWVQCAAIVELDSIVINALSDSRLEVQVAARDALVSTVATMPLSAVAAMLPPFVKMSLKRVKKRKKGSSAALLEKRKAALTVRTAGVLGLSAVILA